MSFNMISRDFEVVGINLKGKGKTPTLSLESAHGEKLTVILPDKSFLSQFKTGMEFSMKLYPGEQATLPFSTLSKPLPEPTTTESESTLLVEEVCEASATIPEGECPKGVFPNEYGTSEVCDDCTHLVREGDPAIGMGAVVCDLDPKSKEETVQPQESA